MHATVTRTAARSAAVTAALLAIPGIAMQFTPEFNWGIEDFVAAAVLIFIAAWACQVVMRIARTRRQRFIMVAAVLAVAALIWAELAVGLFS
jgi:hypothetical membrane protein